MAEVDAKDRKIMYELDLNARQSESEIARRVGLSRESVRYRIDRLESRGYILGYITIVNGVKLDQRWFRTLLKFRNLTPEKDKEITEWLMKKSGWLFKVEGPWDMSSGILAETIYEYRDLIEGFLEKYNQYIEKHEFSVCVIDWICTKDLLIQNKKRTEKPLLIGYARDEERTIEKLDETDLKVLRAVLTEARKKTVDIARETGLTEMIVRHRMKKMQDRGIILGYKPRIDLRLLGYEVFNVRFTLVDYTAQERATMFEYIKQNPAVNVVSEYVPSKGVEMIIRAKGLPALYKEIGKIREKFSKIIRDYEFMHYVEEYKNVQLPLKYLSEAAKE
jgi:DNA-binding Lrp family transcriptional regulator